MLVRALVLTVFVGFVVEAQKNDLPLKARDESRERVIGSGDYITFSRFDGQCTLGLEHMLIRPDGTIVLPLIGKIQVAGLTRSELTKQIDLALTQYLRHPEVSLRVEDRDARELR